MNKPRVAVFGDRLSDYYILGEVKGLSAEAPIPIITVKDHIHLPGGAGNVVANLRSLDVEVVDCTMPGPIKTRLMVGDHQIARWDINDSCLPWQGTLPENIDAIVIADYAKGGVPKNVQWPRDVPMFVDTKRDPICYPIWATFFPNQKEYEQYPNYEDADWVVLKRSEKGVRLYNKGKLVYEELSKARFVRSVNGCGDTLLAGFVRDWLDCLATSPIAHMRIACQFANAAAACAVEKPLTSIVTSEEVQARLGSL